MPRAVAAAVPYAEADRPGPLRMENSNEKKKKRRGARRQQGVRGCGEGPDGGSEGPAVWSSRPSAWPSRTDKRGRCAATMVKEMCLTGGEGSVI